MTPPHDPWSMLGVRRDATVRDVKRRYAQLLKQHRPDDDAEAFAQLRHVYEICLAQAARVEHALQAVDTVEIVGDEEPAAAPQPLHAEPATALEPAPLQEAPPPVDVVEVSLESLHLERLAPLRRPALVVDELLAQSGSSSAALHAWLYACPELANFEARDAVEIELLSRLAAGQLALPARALNALDAHFAWGHHDTRRRLAASVPRALLERIVQVLDHALVEARFEAHLDSGEALYKPESGKAWNGVLGDARRENLLLRRMHAERGDKPRWWRALRPSTIANVNNLLYAWAAHHGHAAADQLFGAQAVRFWQRTLPNAPPNLTRLWLQSMRGLVGIALLFLLVVVATAFEEPAIEQPWVVHATVLGSMMAAFFGLLLFTFTLRWVRQVGVARLRILRLRMLDRCEPFLHPRFVLPALVAWNAPAIWYGATHLAAPVFALGVLAVGAFIGFLPMAGAFVLAGIGAAVLADVPGMAAWQMAAFLANVPTVAWLVDRIAVRATDWHRTRSGKRDAITLTVLVVLAVGIVFGFAR